MPDTTSSLDPRESALNLDADIILYRSLTATLTVPPTPFLLLHMGESAEALFARRASNASAWQAFRNAVSAHCPGIEPWTSTIAWDGRRLASVPERLVYEVLRASVQPCTELALDTHINAAAGKWRTDFELRVPFHRRRIHVEVAGLLASDGKPRTATEADYAARLHAKLDAYAAAGLNPPYIIYVDDVCDRGRLHMAVRRAVAGLESLAA